MDGTSQAALLLRALGAGWVRHRWVGGGGAPSLLRPPCCAHPWLVGAPLCPPQFVSPPRAPAYLPWQTLSPPAEPLSWNPASQLQCRVLSTCAQRGARLKAGSSAWRSGATAGRRRVRATPCPPDLEKGRGARRRAHSAGGGRGGDSPKPPCTAHPGCAAHAAPPKARLRAKAGETASLCRKASHTGSANSRHRSSHLCWRVLLCCVLFLSYSVCSFGLFLNQEQT